MTLLIALVVLGTAGYTVYAAAIKPSFSISASPATQTVTRGSSTSFAVTASRTNFTSDIALKVTGLPSGASATLTPSTLTNGATASTLAISTNGNTATGTYTLTITGTSGSTSHTATVSLVVQAATQAGFTLSASPASQNILQGDSTSYSVSISRTGGFSGSVALSVAGLPSGATASWSPSASTTGSATTLTVNTPNNVATGSFSLTISGTGSPNNTSVTRTAAVTLTIANTVPFQISGNVPSTLAPGRTAALDLTLTNPYSQSLTVQSLTVGLNEQTSVKGCSGSTNFALTQIASVALPFTLPPGTSQLSWIVGSNGLPTVRMLNLTGTNQDACKGASITLNYSGGATK
jgi:uncharacterized membrane protein